MKISNTFIGLAFLALAAYKSFSDVNVLESVLYASVGTGFLLMDLVKKPTLAKYQRVLTILSWVFILAGVLLFIALLRQDAYGL